MFPLHGEAVRTKQGAEAGDLGAAAPVISCADSCAVTCHRVLTVADHVSVSATCRAYCETQRFRGHVCETVCSSTQKKLERVNGHVNVCFLCRGKLRAHNTELKREIWEQQRLIHQLSGQDASYQQAVDKVVLLRT